MVKLRIGTDTLRDEPRFAVQLLQKYTLCLIVVGDFMQITPTGYSEIIQIVDIFRANIVDVSPDSLILVVTGTSDKVDTLIELLRGFGIREMSRTGTIALPRGGSGPLTIEENKPLRRAVEQAAPEEEILPDW